MLYVYTNILAGALGSAVILMLLDLVDFNEAERCCCLAEWCDGI
jgi:hypothetical protein